MELIQINSWLINDLAAKVIISGIFKLFSQITIDVQIVPTCEPMDELQYTL